MEVTVEEVSKIADFHLQHGTTTMLATTLAADDEDLNIKNIITNKEV